MMVSKLKDKKLRILKKLGLNIWFIIDFILFSDVNRMEIIIFSRHNAEYYGGWL